MNLLVEDLLLLVQRQALSERLVVVVPLEFACGVVQVMIQVSIMHFLCAGVLCISYVIDLRKQLHLWVCATVHKRRREINIVPPVLLRPHSPLALLFQFLYLLTDLAASVVQECCLLLMVGLIREICEKDIGYRDACGGRLCRELVQILR